MVLPIVFGRSGTFCGLGERVFSKAFPCLCLPQLWSRVCLNCGRVVGHSLKESNQKIIHWPNFGVIGDGTTECKTFVDLL